MHYNKFNRPFPLNSGLKAGFIKFVSELCHLSKRLSHEGPLPHPTSPTRLRQGGQGLRRAGGRGSANIMIYRENAQKK
jgi:hypothetical protein